MKQESTTIRGNEKKHKKPTLPYWTFSILSSEELESSLSHKAILWHTMEKHIWRLGAASLKMMSFRGAKDFKQRMRKEAVM